MSAISLASKPHYAILDALRGVAALLVVAFHILEAHSTSHLDMMINHSYLAVDFFFLLSGFVIGYAYDDRWQKLTIGVFFKRRLQRLQPMVVLGMVIGAVLFYFGDSTLFPLIHTVTVWKLILVMLIGFTLLPIPIAMDVRGWEEMHPLNGPAWSLFFEYIANILYAIGLRKLSKPALWVLVIITGAALVHYAVTSKTGDVVGGWSLNAEHLRIGFTRLLFPFFAGLLLSRIAKPKPVKNAFFWSTLLLIIFLAMPRIGGSADLWLNGLYDSLSIILIFPLIVYLGACGSAHGIWSARISKFLGDISYPIYITHYPLIYWYTGWVSDHRNLGLSGALPYALLTFAAAIWIAYLSLKYYDEPVRAWLKRKWQ